MNQTTVNYGATAVMPAPPYFQQLYLRAQTPKKRIPTPRFPSEPFEPTQLPSQKWLPSWCIVGV